MSEKDVPFLVTMPGEPASKQATTMDGDVHVYFKEGLPHLVRGVSGGGWSGGQFHNNHNFIKSTFFR